MLTYRMEMMVIRETDAVAQTVAQEGDDEEVQRNLSTASDSSEQCLSILQNLMVSLPSSPSEVI